MTDRKYFHMKFKVNFLSSPLILPKSQEEESLICILLRKVNIHTHKSGEHNIKLRKTNCIPETSYFCYTFWTNDSIEEEKNRIYVLEGFLVCFWFRNKWKLNYNLSEEYNFLLDLVIQGNILSTFPFSIYNCLDSSSQISFIHGQGCF